MLIDNVLPRDGDKDTSGKPEVASGEETAAGKVPTSGTGVDKTEKPSDTDVPVARAGISDDEGMERLSSLGEKLNRVELDRLAECVGVV